MSIDREATARVLEPAVELTTSVATAEPVRIAVSPPPPIETEPVPPGTTEATAPPPVIEVEPLGLDHAATVESEPLVAPIDELDPCDYLEAEVRRVDKKLSAEFSRNESPSLVVHGVLNAVDLLVIAISSAPFLGAIVFTNGSFATTQTRTAAIAIVTLVSLFYLALTHCLCGRTVGMMLTNTRIVEVLGFANPTWKRSLVRAIAYFIAAAPAMIGILWLVGNRKRRGWHDFLSGTFVARDF